MDEDFRLSETLLSEELGGALYEIRMDAFSIKQHELL
jgi:hypothetical protein